MSGLALWLCISSSGLVALLLVVAPPVAISAALSTFELSNKFIKLAAKWTISSEVTKLIAAMAPAGSGGSHSDLVIWSGFDRALLELEFFANSGNSGIGIKAKRLDKMGIAVLRSASEQGVDLQVLHELSQVITGGFQLGKLGAEALNAASKVHQRLSLLLAST